MSSFPQDHPLDGRRGHSFYPPVEALDAIPALYATDGTPFDRKVVHLHYFVAAANWWLCELDPVDLLAFGYCDLGFGMGEWGYVSLADLAELEVRQPLRITEVDAVSGEKIVREGSFPVLVERDLHFTPKLWGEVRLQEG